MKTTPDPLVIGLGCSSAATSAEVIALIHACLAEAGFASSQVTAIATHIRKRDSLALAQAAAAFDLDLRYLADDELADCPGTCEAVAAAAGPLLLGKRKSRYATCAVALAAPDFVPAAFGQPANPSAAMASLTLDTSLAGP